MLTYLSVRVGVVEEAGVPPLVISLVINIRALIRPLLGHPGQPVVPDLVRGGEIVTRGDHGGTLYLPLGPYSLPWADHRNHELSYFSPAHRQICINTKPFVLENVPRHHQVENNLGLG